MLGAQPMLAAAAAAPRTRWRAAATRSANGPPGASGPPLEPCHRRLGGRAGGGERGSSVRKRGRPFYRGAGAAAAAAARGRWGGRRAAAAPPNMPFLRREPPAALTKRPARRGRFRGIAGGGDLRSPGPRVPAAPAPRPAAPTPSRLRALGRRPGKYRPSLGGGPAGLDAPAVEGWGLRAEDSPSVRGRCGRGRLRREEPQLRTARPRRREPQRRLRSPGSR